MGRTLSSRRPLPRLPVRRPGAGLFGAVSFDVFGQYGPDTFGDLDALFAHTMDVLAESLGYLAA